MSLEASVKLVAWAEGLSFLFGQAGLSSGLGFLFRQAKCSQTGQLPFPLGVKASQDRDPTTATNFVQLGFSSNITSDTKTLTNFIKNFNFCGRQYFNSLVAKPLSNLFSDGSSN